MSVDERMLAVIEALYDAALDETSWPQALKELTDFTGSQGASFWVLDASEQPRLPTFIALNFESNFIEDYLVNMARVDPTVQYLVRHPSTPIVHDGLVIGDEEKDRHPYYDWHRSYSDTNFRMVGQVRPVPAVQAGVALHRTRQAGRFTPHDIDQFAILHRHLGNALAIGSRLGTLGAMQQCTTELLDGSPAAVLLLDERKRLAYANRHASVLSSSGDGIVLSAQGIILQRKQENERLQTLIAQALQLKTSAGVLFNGMMRASRPSGKRPYLILVSPVAKRYSALSALRPAVCIVIADPDRDMQFPLFRLQAAFGLTEAEARLAALLASGEELRFAAEKLGITYGTARTRLAEIFQKTETRRQAELMKILLTTLAMG
jgi:DNA-binding CsgD family transcriptional regulator